MRAAVPAKSSVSSAKRAVWERMSKSTADVLGRIRGSVRRRPDADVSAVPSAPIPTPAASSPIPRSPVVTTSGPPSRRRGKRVIGGDDVDSEEAREEARPLKRAASPAVKLVKLPPVEGLGAWKISHNFTPCNAPTVTRDGHRSAECYYQRRSRDCLVGVVPAAGKYMEGCGADIDRLLRKSLERSSEVSIFNLSAVIVFFLDFA
jgi:hypothetical protein